MGREDVQRLIGMACTDPDFRAKLLQDPEAAAREYGMNLSPDEVENLRNVHPADINEFASAFIARFGSDRAAY